MKKRIFSFVLALAMTVTMIPGMTANAEENAGVYQYTEAEHQLALERDEEALTDSVLIMKEDAEAEQKLAGSTAPSSSFYMSVSHEYPVHYAGNDVYVELYDYKEDFDLSVLYPYLVTEDGTVVSSVVDRAYESRGQLIYHLQKPADVAWDSISYIRVGAAQGSNVDTEFLENTVDYFSMPDYPVMYHLNYSVPSKILSVYMSNVPDGTVYDAVFTEDYSGEEVVSRCEDVVVTGNYAELPHDAPRGYDYGYLHFYDAEGNEAMKCGITTFNYPLDVYSSTDMYNYAGGAKELTLYSRFYADAVSDDSITVKLFNQNGEQVGVDSPLTKVDYNGSTTLFGERKELSMYAGTVYSWVPIEAGEYTAKYYRNNVEIPSDEQYVYVMNAGTNYIYNIYQSDWKKGSASLKFYIAGFWSDNFDVSKLTFKFTDRDGNELTGTNVTFNSMEEKSDNYYGREYYQDVYFTAVNEAFKDCSRVSCEVFYDGQPLKDAQSAQNDYGKDNMYPSTASSSSEEKYFSTRSYHNTIYGISYEGYEGEKFTMNMRCPYSTEILKSFTADAVGDCYNFTPADMQWLDTNLNTMYAMEVWDSKGNLVDIVNNYYFHDYRGLYFRSGDVTVEPGQQVQLYAVDTTGGTLSWRTQNANIANVDANGLVTAGMEGETTVIVYSTNSRYGYGCDVIVAKEIIIPATPVTQLPGTLDGLTYVENGVPVASANGLVEYGGAWFLVENGAVNTSDTTLKVVEFSGAKFVAGGGQLATHVSGLLQVGSEWYFLANGLIQTQYSGLAQYDGQWFVVEQGTFRSDYSGLIDYDGATFLVSDGRLRYDYTGLYLDALTNDWYYIGSGQVIDYTGLALYDGHWFYCKRGILAEDFTGWVEYNGSAFYVVNGQLAS